MIFILYCKGFSTMIQLMYSLSLCYEKTNEVNYNIIFIIFIINGIKKVFKK